MKPESGDLKGVEDVKFFAANGRLLDEASKWTEKSFNDVI